MGRDSLASKLRARKQPNFVTLHSVEGFLAVEATHVARRARELEIDWFGNPGEKRDHGGEPVGEAGT